MKKAIKYSLISIFSLVAMVFILIASFLYWPSKYDVGDCLQSGEYIFLFDSDGPLLSGKYGLKQLVPTHSSNPSVVISKEVVESDGWNKVACPEMNVSEVSTCPANETLCEKFSNLVDECAQNKNACDEFVDTFSTLTAKYDCKRSFDTKPVPAIWLCNKITGNPKLHEDAVQLLSTLKTEKAKNFFASEELQSTLDGHLAEQFMIKK